MTRPRIHFAPLRYRVLFLRGWRWRRGFAIDLPGYPSLRFCCHRERGRWLIDQFDTGMCYSVIRPATSRILAAVLLLAMAPSLMAGGRYTKQLRRAAASIRRARALGQLRKP